MPRICTSASDPIDFCEKCMPHERAARMEFGNVGNGPDGRGNCFEYKPDHPSYDDDDYTCENCGKKLTAKDD